MLQKLKNFKFKPEAVVFLFLLGWAGVLMCQKIDLTTADLGRHITNGSILLHGSLTDIGGLLHTNFYSYTEPNREFVNHHWGTGLVFYLIYKLAGFSGLSVFYILLNVAAFGIFFRLAQKQAGSAVAAALSVVLLPIITSRTEVRPEGFSYLFAGIFFWLLYDNTRNGRGSKTAAADINADRDKSRKVGRLWILPVLMLLWVNLHIGFIVGIGILGLFWGNEFLKLIFRKDNQTKQLGVVLLSTIAAALVNPWGLKGLLYPLNIFRSYGYMVLENQSVLFLRHLNLGSNLYFGLFEVMLVAAFLSFILVLFKERKKFSLVNFLLLVSFALISFNAIRNFPLFGLFAIPIMAGNINLLLPKFKHIAYRLIPVAVCVAIIIAAGLRFSSGVFQRGASFGIGLTPGVALSADFFKTNNISGPIFNNYDIGGYLIFNTRIPRGSLTAAADINADQGVFVDNRPEAYSVSFFQDVYIPAQADEQKWKELDRQYNFNAIFFGYHDYTPWAQTFLISKVNDPAWAPVFVDSYSIIFVKRNAKNQILISKYEIPKERFGVVKN